MKHILVTGGAGFIGSHTVDTLLENNFKVTVYDNFSTGKLSNLNVFDSRLEVIQGDILDYSNLKKAIARCDTVLHLAALASVPKSIEDPILSHNVNLMGFLNVLQIIREMDISKRIVYASSAAVYGNAEILPCSEDAPIGRALSPYALEKADTERYADLFSHLFKMRTLGLRYFNVYGDRQDPSSPYSGVISRFIAAFQKSEPLTIYGDGEQSRDFIHVKDVARANLMALESHVEGVLNIATGTAETLNDMLKYLSKLGHRPIPHEFAPKRMGDIAHSYASVLKAKENLKFVAELSLEQGLQKLILGQEN